MTITAKDIEQFLNSNRMNKGGKKYKLFNSKHYKRDKLYLQQAIEEFCAGLNLIVGVESQQLVDEQIKQTFDRIIGIRIDDKDGKIPPLCFTVNDMKDNHNGKLDSNGGVTLAKMFHGGILMLVPALKTEIENIQEGDTNGVHTLFHEFVHAMSVWERGNAANKQYVTGFQIFGKGIFDDLNEGMTEYITYYLMKNLYECTSLENSIECREGTRIPLVESIFEIFTKEEQSQIITYFLTGQSAKVFEMFDNVKHISGQNLMDFLKTNYQDQNRGISNCNIAGHPQLNQDLQVLGEITDFLGDCQFQKEDEQEILQ